MSQEMYFFKFDLDKINANLQKALTCDEQFSFRKYHELNGWNNFPKTVDRIINDLPEIYDLDFNSFWNWLIWKIKSLYPDASLNEIDRKVENEFAKLGMKYISSLDNKGQVGNFFNILNKFDEHTNEIYEFGWISSKEDFEKFLDYLIYYSLKREEFYQKYYWERPINKMYKAENFLLQYDISESNECIVLAKNQLALEGVNHADKINAIKRYNELWNTDKKHLIEIELADSIDFIHELGMHEFFASKCLEIKHAIINFDGLIYRYHSY